jgi:hypothetical protein
MLYLFLVVAFAARTNVECFTVSFNHDYVGLNQVCGHFYCHRQEEEHHVPLYGTLHYTHNATLRSSAVSGATEIIASAGGRER